MSFLLRAALLAPLLALAPAADAQCIVSSTGTGIQCNTLYAGQTINAGSVCLEIVNGELIVTYNTTGGWQLVEAHIWVGTSLASMPQTKSGNPKIGNFPYASGDITGATTYTQTISLGNIFTCPNTVTRRLFIAAHAALRLPLPGGGFQYETGWSEGSRFVEQGNWGTYSGVVVTCDCATTPPESKCETAYLYSEGEATCFTSLPLGSNNWGWTNHFEAAGTHQAQIYAGAGGCSLTAGTNVGTSFVIYTPPASATERGKVVVEIVMADCGSTKFKVEEAHLYVGGEVLPRDNQGEFTSAPGQFPLKYDYTEGKSVLRYEVDLMPGVENPYVVLHMVVCANATCFQ